MEFIAIILIICFLPFYYGKLSNKILDLISVDL